MHVLHFRTVSSWPIIGHIFKVFVAQRHIEAITEVLKLIKAELLNLVGGIFGFTGVTHAVALDRFCQNYSWLPPVIHRGVVRGINLVRVMTTSIKAIYIFIAQMLNHLQQLGVLGEKVLSNVLPTLGFEILIFAIHCGVHRALHQTLFIFGK